MLERMLICWSTVFVGQEMLWGSHADGRSPGHEQWLNVLDHDDDDDDAFYSSVLYVEGRRVLTSLPSNYVSMMISCLDRPTRQQRHGETGGKPSKHPSPKLHHRTTLLSVEVW